MPLRFGDLARSHRRRACLTQEQLAERSGISARTITDIECGRVSRPHGTTVRRLAEALCLGDDARTTFEAAARRSSSTVLQEASPDARPAAARIIVAVPRTLPRPPSPFFGRDEEMARLRQIYAESLDTPLMVTGVAGVGKTALAVAFAHEISAEFPDGQLFIDLHGHDPLHPAVEPHEAVARAVSMIEGPEAVVPRGLDEAIARYRSLLAGSRTLVVVDDARSSEQIRPLLPGSTTCRVVVTSRRPLPDLVARDGASIVGIDVLSHAAATTLIGELTGRRDRLARSNAAHLAAVCGYLPSTLRGAAAQLVCTHTATGSLPSGLATAGADAPSTAVVLAGSPAGEPASHSSWTLGTAAFEDGGVRGRSHGTERGGVAGATPPSC